MVYWIIHFEIPNKRNEIYDSHEKDHGSFNSLIIQGSRPGTFNMVYNVVRAKYVDLNGRGGKYRGEAQPNLR